MGVMKAPAAEKQGLVDAWVAAAKKEIEPLLADAGPFFGGSKELTMAEAIVAPFLLRWYTMADDTFIPKSLVTGLEELPNFKKWSEAVRSHPSALKIWEPEKFMEGFLRKYGKVFERM